MTVRPKWILVAVPVLALALSACVNDVTQESSGSFLRASFDSTTGAIPLPNDLALQGAFKLPLSAKRSGLFNLIGLGGYFPTTVAPFPAPPAPFTALGAASVINIPYEFVSEGVGTSALPDPGFAISTGTVTRSTLAILQVTGPGAPQQFDPIAIPTTNAVVLAVPAPGGYVAGSRYVVALRGGPNGVKTVNGHTLTQSTPIYLITHGVNFSSPETRPFTVSDAQAKQLQQVQGLLANPVDWTEVLSSTACAAINAPAPSSAFVDPGAPTAPNGACWVPLVSPSIPGFPGSPPSQGALASVGTVFPVTEAVSIQTFEIQ
jgi:hypothetical protein